MDQIYFRRDTDNELNGPFTERHVQEWYREKWFDGGVKFYFMANDEQPTDDSPAITMDELISRFGIGCPFARVCDDNSHKRNEQLTQLEKKLETAREEIVSMAAMEQRVQQLEQQLKTLENEPSQATSASHVASVASTSADTKEKNSEKKPAPSDEEYVPDWIPHFMQFFLDGYDALATNKDPASYWQHDDMRVVQIRLPHVLSHPPSKAILLRELKKAVAAKEFLYCAPCNRVLQNYRLAFLHLTDPEHEAKAVARFPIWSTLTDLLVDFFDIHLATRWMNAEIADIEARKERFRAVPLNSTTLRPSADLLRRLPDYNRELWDASIPEGVNKVRAMMPKLRGDLGKMIMKEIDENIKDTQTRCLPCGIVVGSSHDYYEHILGPWHMNKVTSQDVITLVVNAHKKELVK